MQGGMVAYTTQNRTQDQVATWRDEHPFGTPMWEVMGHPLREEEDVPAVQWITDCHYEGDEEVEAARVVWDEICDLDRMEPYVLFVYRMGLLIKRIDIC